MKTTLSFLVFIGASLIIWWSLTINSEKNGTSAPDRNLPYVEVFMNEFKITSLNSFGVAEYTLTGTRLEQYNNSDNAIITLPVFHFLQIDNQWLITADKAVINKEKNTIKLSENVVMQQQNSPQAIKVSSDVMIINTKKQTAQTKAPVTIEQGLSKVKSIGMVYFNKQAKLVLKSDVHGYYLNTNLSD